jgi:F-box protein 9
MEDNAELESFRREWREEVARRSKPGSAPQAAPRSAAPPQTRLPPNHHAAADRKDLEEEGPPPASFDPEELAQQVGELSVQPEEEVDEDGFTRRHTAEPNTALEHFERAVEKEAAGKLGDSLQHYRKAYRVSVWFNFMVYVCINTE